MSENPSPVGSSDLAGQYLIDELFGAIQMRTPEGVHRMREILRDHPKLANMRSEPDKMHTEMSGQDLLNNQKLGYLLTQDVLRSRQGENVEIQCKFSQKPLHFACLLGNLDAVQLLLEQPDIDLNAKNGSEETPLGVACRAAQLIIADRLLEKSNSMTDSRQKIHVDQQDDAFNTPIEYLVCQGIYPVWANDPPDDDLKTLAKAIVLASKQDSTISHDDFEESCLRMALRHASYWLLKCILDTVPTIKNRELDEDGWRPLHFATMRGDREAVKMLLEAGADAQLVLDASGGMIAQAFARIASDPDIARMIDSSNPTQSQIEFPQDPKGWVLSGGIKQSGGVSDGPTGFELKELPVGDLVEKMKKKKKNRSTESDPQNVTWYHLPATNWKWVKLLFEAAPTNKQNELLIPHIGKHFGHSKYSSLSTPFFIDQLVREASEDEKNKALQDNPRNFMAMLPTIDIDVLDGFRFYKSDNYPNSCEQNVMKLYAGTQPELQAPKTLDHYYQNELDRERLDELNQEQVFTRYLRWFHERRQAVATPHFWRGLWGQFKTADQPQQPGQPQSSMNQTTAITKTAIRLAERRQSHRSFQEASKLERQSSQDNQTRLADTGTQAEQEDQTDWSQPHTDRIMVVSQLWLFRSDNVIVTLYPQRRSTRALKQGLQLPGVIQKLFNGTEKPHVLYHDIIKNTMQHESSITIHGESMKYLEVFSREVLRLSEDIDKHYEAFQQYLGQSDKHFRDLSEEVIKCLLHINDVVGELSTVRRVLEDRSTAWQKMHESGWIQQGPSKTECRWGVADCDPIRVRESSLVNVKRVNKSAEAVQKKVQSLVALIHGQAGTENAIRSSEQARYLAIFTWLTVFFSPLSFVMSLLALDIDSFTPTNWNMPQVAIACIVSVAVTIILCGLPFSWMKYSNGWEGSVMDLFTLVRYPWYVIRMSWFRLNARRHARARRTQFKSDRNLS